MRESDWPKSTDKQARGHMLRMSSLLQEPASKVTEEKPDGQSIATTRFGLVDL